MDLLLKLGIDWRLLIAQIINFLILLFILYRFLYKPVLKMLHDRTSKIEKSLKDVKKIEQHLKTTEEERALKIAEARKMAQTIIEQAKTEAEKVKNVTLGQAKEEAHKIIEDNKKQLESQKETLIKEAKASVVDLVIQTSRRVLSEVMDDKLEKKLVEKTVERTKKV